MDKNKFRFWNPQVKGFVQNYKYNGFVDELFEPDEFLKPQQFLGILDKNMKELYEGDVVNFDYFDGDKSAIGVVRYNNSSCAYEVVGNIIQLPCNPDHNGECLVCDCWLSDCQFLNKEKD